MSEENVEIVRAIYRGWARGNLGAALPFYDPEVKLESFNYSAPGESFVGHGPDGIRQFVRDFLSDVDDYRLIAEEVIRLDDEHVLVVGYHTARGRQSGVPVRDPALTVWRFREGRVVRLIIGRDRDRVVEAAGLRE
jgi:ketosteroid isomerase-like protein